MFYKLKTSTPKVPNCKKITLVAKKVSIPNSTKFLPNKKVFANKKLYLTKFYFSKITVTGPSLTKLTCI